MDGVVPFARGQAVGKGGATQHHMVDAAVADGAIGQAAEQRCLVVGRERIIENGSAGSQASGFKQEGRCGEHIPG